MFSDVLANYTIAIDNNGTADTAQDVYRDRCRYRIGWSDVVRQIERLQFADQLPVVGGLNEEPVGSPTISDVAMPSYQNQLFQIRLPHRRGDGTLKIQAERTTVCHDDWQVEGTGGVFTDIRREYLADPGAW